MGKACQHPLDLRLSRDHPARLLILLSHYGTGAWFLGRQVQTAVPFAIEPPEPQLGFLCATPTNNAPLPSNTQTHPWRTAHTALHTRSPSAASALCDARMGREPMGQAECT